MVPDRHLAILKKKYQIPLQILYQKKYLIQIPILTFEKVSDTDTDTDIDTDTRYSVWAKTTI